MLTYDVDLRDAYAWKISIFLMAILATADPNKKQKVLQNITSFLVTIFNKINNSITNLSKSNLSQFYYNILIVE